MPCRYGKSAAHKMTNTVVKYSMKKKLQKKVKEPKMNLDHL